MVNLVKDPALVKGGWFYNPVYIFKIQVDSPISISISTQVQEQVGEREVVSMLKTVGQYCTPGHLKTSLRYSAVFLTMSGILNCDYYNRFQLRALE